MKRFYLSLILVTAVLFGAIESRAGVIAGGYTTVPITTAQTNTATFFTNTVTYLAVSPQVTITNNALAITNAYTAYWRYSPDNGTTWFTNGSPVFIPTNTAAQNYILPGKSFYTTFQYQLLLVTNTANTSAIQFGATSP